MAGMLTVCERNKGGKSELMNKLYNFYSKGQYPREWLLKCVVTHQLENEFVSNDQLQ